MPTIKLTDQLGLNVDVKPAATSALLKYFQSLTAMRLENLDISKVGGLTLDQPALKSLKTGVAFSQGVPIGEGIPDLRVRAGANAQFCLISGSPSSVTGVDIETPAGTCYASFGITASAGVSESGESGQLSFGVTPSTNVEITYYRNLPLNGGLTLLDALRQTIESFVIPARVEDLASLPEHGVATVHGAGSLKLSVTADLLAVTNPLASLTLPSPLPGVSVGAGGSVQIGATYKIGCEYTMCAHKLDASHVRVGWYRKKFTELSVDATVSGSLDTTAGTMDPFSMVMSAISADAAADQKELKQAGLDAGQMGAIQSAVRAAVARKLELALSAGLTATRSGDAAFAYDIDLGALTPPSESALDAALRGDLSGLHAGALPGIACVQSVWEKVRETSLTLSVNLLGIYNYRSIASLIKSGKVLCEAATGALVITDQATAERIQSSQVNFGADTQKLRRVMAESFLITAAYQGSQRLQGGPVLSCSHSFFDLDNSTSRDEMRRKLRVGTALGLFSGDDSALLDGVKDFGRTMIHASTEYDNSLSASLFLDRDGKPLLHGFYENMGRAAIQLLVGEDDADAARRAPAQDNTLWSEMKRKGQANFAQLFPKLPAPLLGAVIADYSAIIWWADAMSGAAVQLAAMRQFFDRNPATALDNPEFQKVRKLLADHLAQVAARTHDEFGQPWGLVAMNEASNRCAGASILISSPNLARMKSSKRVAVAGS